MFIDLGELADAEEVEAGVCIVGSGPVGLALARELSGAGRGTVIVESGGFAPSEDISRLNHGRSVGLPGVGFTSGRARAFGGTSRLWAGQCLPLDPWDFEQRSWIPDSGWPISQLEMVPYLERAARFFDVEDEPFDQRVWAPFGLAPLAFDEAKLRHLATVYTPQHDLGARFGPEFERSATIRVLLRATAARLEVSEGGKAVTGLLAKGMDGREVRVRADAFVLCAGAIENARLMLLSGGIGNEHGMVGRYFQDHPNARVGTVRTDSPGTLLDRYSLLYRKPLRHFPKIGMSPELQSEKKVMNGIANLVFDFGSDSGLEALKRLYRSRRFHLRPVDFGRDLLRVGRDLPQLTRNYGRIRAGLSPSASIERIILQVHAEQAPDRESRVGLGDELDPLGLPVAEVDWRVGELDLRTMRILAEAVGGEMGRLGLGSVRPNEGLGDGQLVEGLSGAYHHMGTTRMSDDPRRGVVDRDCAVHAVPGLYCGGGSIFPTGGAANPTLTMVALAIRLGDHLKRSTG